ncbi:general secretion pathway protein I [Brevundimonas sp. UYEF29]|jgi:general secretion pathway protein I|uniref:type II secretion system minor pseudopilin GspI n=1 Tax=unclassified Brevundimonas TaxID=2622653 RepID=UPI0033912B5F
MTDRRARRDGFTLVEMLVAMAVFGLSAMALLNLAGENTRSAARVESRTLGGVVADNLVVEAVIAPSLSDGVSNGRTNLAGRDWSWTRIVAPTDVADIQRVEVRVSNDEGQAADRTAFRARSS